MKKFLFGSVALVALAAIGSAMAADLPVKTPVYKAPVVAPPYNWTGFYVGGHVGYLWGRTRVEENGVLTEPGAATNGAVGGVLAGANWQSGPLVLGIEGDIGWSNAHGTGIVPPPPPPPPPPPSPSPSPNTYDIKWTSHFRARAGYSVGPWLLFAAGGLAFAHFNFHDGETNVVSASTFTGGSIGGGVEYAFTDRMTGRVEYLYDEFGHKTFVSGTDGYRVGLTAQTLRAAFSLKFD